jgi:hypothetical protein
MKRKPIDLEKIFAAIEQLMGTDYINPVLARNLIITIANEKGLRPSETTKVTCMDVIRELTEDQQDTLQAMISLFGFNVRESILVLTGKELQFNGIPVAIHSIRAKIEEMQPEMA